MEYLGILLLIVILVGCLLGGYYFGKIKQGETFKSYQDEIFKNVDNNFQKEVINLRQQLLDVLNSYIGQITGRMDTFNHQVEVRFGEISREVNHQLNQGYEENRNLFGEVIQRLSLIDHTQEQLGNLGGQIQNLQNTLNDKRARGAFGEMQLHLLLQETMAESQYYLQYSLSNGCRVDCFLKLPNAMGNIAIDSKFPLDNYRKALDVSLSDKERNFFRSQFKADIKRHIQSIAEKYIIPGETAEGAIMFLPSESIFAEIHSCCLELVNFSYQKRVWIVSPSTLMALLLTISSLIKDARTHHNMEEIRVRLATLSKEFSRFQERIENFTRHYRLAEDGLNQIKLTADKIIKNFHQIANYEEIE